MKIFLATDHAGFEHKEILKKYLVDAGHEVHDCGADKLVAGDDYVPYIVMATRSVSADPESKAIIFGGSGQGEAVTANRFPGVRAAVYYGETDNGKTMEIIKLSRLHNDSNVLSIGARFVTHEEMIKAVDVWLTTPFSNEERHVRRIKEIDTLSW